MAKFSSINFGMVLGYRLGSGVTDKIQGFESSILRLGNLAGWRWYHGVKVLGL